MAESQSHAGKQKQDQARTKTDVHAPEPMAADVEMAAPEPLPALNMLEATRPEQVVSLQRLVGNRAVQRMLADGRIQRQAAATGAAAGATTGTADGPQGDNGRAIFERGAALFEQGQYAQALTMFERVRQMEDIPDEVRRDTTYNIGQCNMRLQRYATAIIYFEQYITMPGANVDGATAHLTEARQAIGTVNAEGEENAPLTREQAHALFDTAISQVAAGQYRQAIISFERLRQLADDLPEEIRRDVTYNMGICNLRLERFATSVIYFEQYMTMAGANLDDARARLAEAYAGMGTGARAGELGASAERDWEQANPAGGVMREGNRLILWNFAVGADALKPEHIAALRQFLRDNEVAFLDIATHVRFVGHASTTGSESSNDGLGLMRAMSAAGWAAESSGILSWERVDMDSLGERAPRVPDTSPENMARNRRVEVEVVMAPRPERTEEPPEPTPVPPGETPAPDAEPRYTSFSIRMIAGAEGGEVVGGGFYTYEIRENQNGSSVMYSFIGGGLTAGAPVGGYGPSDWSDFTTETPMRLQDFEGGGRMASAGSYVGVGAGVGTLVFYCGDLPTVTVESYIPSLGAGLGIGVSWWGIGWWELRD